jgi:AcrR family transcriptional regulator
LVHAARNVFERDGFLESRITDITAEAGVAAGTFYTYFKSKDDALAAVLAEVEEEMLHPQVQELADRGDPAGVIAAANAAYLAAYRRNAKLMGLMEQVSLLDERFRALRLDRSRAFVRRNATALRTLQRKGRADPELDPELAALALSSMVSRMAYLRYVQGFSDASAASLTRTLTRLWTNALGIAPPTSNRRPADGARR